MSACKDVEYLSVKEACRILGVAKSTVSRWMKYGRIKGLRLGTGGSGRGSVLVLRSCLEDAFKARCALCGRTFKSRAPGHPGKRKFCCLEHRIEWAPRMSRRYIRRGRPPKDEKARRALLVN